MFFRGDGAEEFPSAPERLREQDISIARQRQREFSEEIRRIGKGYFVQVPYRWYPIETHSWLPCFSYLPRPTQISLLHLTNGFGSSRQSRIFIFRPKPR